MQTRSYLILLALGASPSRTLRMIVGQSVGWAVLGLACGLGVALVAARFIEPLLFETSPYDIVVFAATGALLMAVAVAASLAPAVRASRVDPNVALRAE